MLLVGLVTFSLLSSILSVSGMSLFQNALAKTNVVEPDGNATRDDAKGRNVSGGVGAQNVERSGRNQLVDGTLYKDSYSTVKANSGESFTVYPDKHLYKPGQNVTLNGSIWTNLLAELHDHANLVIMELKDNRLVEVARAEARIGQNGEYSAAFMLPMDVKPGAYSVQATIHVDSGLLEMLEPSVRAKLQTSVRFVIVNPQAFAIKFEDKEFRVDIATNSTSVKEFSFLEQQNKVSFKVEGERGTKGVVQVTVPVELLGEEVHVSIDGHLLPADSNDVIITSDNANEMTLEINYHHSERTIQLHGKPIVPPSPELSTAVSVTLGSVVALVAVVSILLLIRYLGRQRQRGMTNRGGKHQFGFPSFPFGQNPKGDFCCISCGTRHDLSACPNCGSKLKKVTF